MTSFLIDEHLNRKVHDEWKDDSLCSFCRIISKELSSLTIYETDKVIAILGGRCRISQYVAPYDMVYRHTTIASGAYAGVSQDPYLECFRPTTRHCGCHGDGCFQGRKCANPGYSTLLTPACHGRRGLMAFGLVALQNTALNVVCNQEYAQSVPHVGEVSKGFAQHMNDWFAGSFPHHSRSQVCRLETTIPVQFIADHWPTHQAK